MAIRVEIEGHDPIEFPEGTDQSIIDMVVKRDIIGQKEKGFVENVSSAMTKRAENIQNIPQDIKGTPEGLVGPRALLRMGGEAVGGAWDILGEGVKSLYKTIIPKGAQEDIASGLKELVQPQPGKRNLMEDISSVPKRLEDLYPGASKDIESASNLLMLPPGKKVAQVAGAGIKEGTNIGRDLLSFSLRKTPDEVDKAITGVVKENLGKTIRLAPQGKATWKAVEGYFEKSGGAIQDIVKNKENLNLTNIVGDTVKNQLPETRIQMAQSIHDTKSRLFNEFNAKNIAAGKKGATVDLESIAKELDAVINNKTLLADADGRVIIEHAKLQQQYLREAGSFTPGQAQEWITRANSKLSPAYAKGTFQDISRAGVDESMASMMRKTLDSAMEQVGEKGYQDLKNRYGALVQLEKGANKASVASLSKANMPNFFDITSGTALVHGLLAMNPATITAAGFMEAMNIARRHFQNPDTYVKNMFSKTEKLMNKRSLSVLESKSKLFAATPETRSFEPPPIKINPEIEKQGMKELRAIVGGGKGERPLALPPGQGFNFYAVPESSKFSPQLAKELQKLKQLALPEGQGFELVEKSRLAHYYDTLSEQVGGLKHATPAEKIEIRQRIKIDKKKALEKAQTEQIYEAFQ